mmetsp:Transcript_23421/g.88939  ORF Transcript_23421/g.88939 Transcript_23421/m.88939 type:complete len:530 (+) Transcript_23421:153-1742(+)
MVVMHLFGWRDGLSARRCCGVRLCLQPALDLRDPSAHVARHSAHHVVELPGRQRNADVTASLDGGLAARRPCFAHQVGHRLRECLGREGREFRGERAHRCVDGAQVRRLHDGRLERGRPGLERLVRSPVGCRRGLPDELRLGVGKHAVEASAVRRHDGVEEPGRLSTGVAEAGLCVGCPLSRGGRSRGHSRCELPRAPLGHAPRRQRGASLDLGELGFGGGPRAAGARVFAPANGVCPRLPRSLLRQIQGLGSRPVLGLRSLGSHGRHGIGGRHVSGHRVAKAREAGGLVHPRHDLRLCAPLLGSLVEGVARVQVRSPEGLAGVDPERCSPGLRHHVLQRCHAGGGPVDGSWRRHRIDGLQGSRPPNGLQGGRALLAQAHTGIHSSADGGLDQRHATVPHRPQERGVAGLRALGQPAQRRLAGRRDPVRHPLVAAAGHLRVVRCSLADVAKGGSEERLRDAAAPAGPNAQLVRSPAGRLAHVIGARAHLGSEHCRLDVGREQPGDAVAVDCRAERFQNGSERPRVKVAV